MTSQQGQVGSVKNQLASLADEILAFNVQLEQVSGDKRSSEQQVRNLSDKLSVLEQRNSSLSGRITSLENELREIATKVVSRSTTSATNSAPSSTASVSEG